MLPTTFHGNQKQPLGFLTVHLLKLTVQFAPESHGGWETNKPFLLELSSFRCNSLVFGRVYGGILSNISRL